MHNRNYTIEINASRSKVWEVLWNDQTYREWTAAFFPGSRAITDWKKGSKVYFVDNEDRGMYSMIEENIPNEYMSIKHLGVIKDGVEKEANPQENEWGEGSENYTLTEENGKTKLVVSMESATIPEEFITYFDETWPVALGKLKRIAENN